MRLSLQHFAPGSGSIGNANIPGARCKVPAARSSRKDNSWSRFQTVGLLSAATSLIYRLCHVMRDHSSALLYILPPHSCNSASVEVLWNKRTFVTRIISAGALSKAGKAFPWLRILLLLCLSCQSAEGRVGGASGGNRGQRVCVFFFLFFFADFNQLYAATSVTSYWTQTNKT